ncbi:MAG: N-6 DNA methylase [Flavobacteriaceae bacterium]|nr:N-6 DNA methylase [Flavobacteriaceae bacterium]
MQHSIINNLDIIDFAENSEVFDIDIFDIANYGAVKVYGNEGQPALFLKEVDSFDLDTLKIIAKIQHDCWNFQKVLFLYVYSKSEIRIYNCSEKPFVYSIDNENINFENELHNLELYSCKESDKSKLATLNTLFSRIAIDTGFIWSATEAKEIRDKLNLQNRVDKYLIKSLINVSKKLQNEGLEDKDIIHKLMMRSLFLLYLQDKGATTKDFYNGFFEGADSYFKILESPQATYSLFERLSNDFNGSLFSISDNEKDIVNTEHLDLIRRCFINGYEENEQTILFEDWRLFDFKIIRIELLSEIYENFLSELDKKGKKDSGTFYTPPSLVELILNEKLPVKNNESNYSIKTLDPSCGSGIFLVQSFKRLVKRYENKHNEKLSDFNILEKILKENIFGIEIDQKSIKVAAFSLYLALLDNLDPRTGWWNGKIKFPYLINDPDDKSLEAQGSNLFKRDTISNFEISQLQNFDLVIGNPPFGKLLSETKDVENKQKYIREYCNKENFAKEMVLPFLHKATLLASKGQIALIFNTKVLTNTGGTYQNFRRWLFNENYVEKIYNFSILRNVSESEGGSLFGSAVGPISIIFYQKDKPNHSKDTITYYAPKTYVKNDVLEGIVIDSSDVKHLPRTECEKPDTKIWKIAMWGSYYDFVLIDKIESKYDNLKNHFKESNIEYRTGLNGDLENPDFIPESIVKTSSIERYITPISAIEPNTKYFRKIDEDLFIPPYVAIKKGQKDKLITASLISHNAYCMSGAYIINNNITKEEKKGIVAFINSKFSVYFLFLISSSWGIEREQIMSNEFLFLPYFFNDAKTLNRISSFFDKIVSIKESDALIKEYSNFEFKINEVIINQILNLSEDEKIIIDDTLNYSLDLFEKKKKSDAVKSVIDNNTYTNRLIKDLNDWLSDVNLKASATHYEINNNCPLYLVKLTFGTQHNETKISEENIYNELKTLDRKLWEEESSNLYFRKKINYYDGNDVYIIKPNQRRFWSQTAAMEDSKTLLIEIGQGNG